MSDTHNIQQAPVNPAMLQILLYFGHNFSMKEFWFGSEIYMR